MHNRRIVIAAAAAAVLLLLAGAVTPTRVLAQARVQRLDYRSRTLPNGLRVLSVEDHSSPTVAIQVWYKVGAKDDPQGRSGFAHLFEHMMFKSTRNMPSEMLDRLTEDVGGENNAYTGDDVTVYHEVVPSHYLETLLWAEGERMGSLNVSEATFASERDVVKEEFRQNYLTPPYGRMSLLLDQKSFAVHPYTRPGIGNIAELNAATLPHVQAFHRTFYRPDNATLVVVGDFDAKQLDTWVDKYLGRVPRPAAPLPRVTVKEPPRTRERRYVEYGANVPLPAVAITYLAPTKVSSDAFALSIADMILSGGESSRLYRKLVYEQQLAQEAYSYNDLREQAGLFVLRATLAGGKKPEQAERALMAELKRMQDSPISAAELNKARNQVLTGLLRERETNEGKAEALGEAAVLLNNAERVNTDIARLQAVTAADVQRVLRKYFGPGAKRVVIYYLPESSRPTATKKAQEAR